MGRANPRGLILLDMKILAIDTTLNACSVAAVKADRSDIHLLAERHVPMTSGHAEALIALIDEVIGESGLIFTTLDRIAVTTGPGTFTGVRTGLASALGLSVAAKCPVVGLTTFEAIAANTLAPEVNPEAKPVTVAIDARRREIYVQRFSATLTPLSEPAVMPIMRARDMPAMTNALIVGTGARHLCDEEAPAGLQILPRASVFAGCVVSKPLPDTPPTPLYLRAPDARPQAALPNIQKTI